MITKNRPLRRNVDIKRALAKKKQFFHSAHKNSPFLLNVDIFGHMIYSELGRHSNTLTCCSGA